MDDMEEYGLLRKILKRQLGTQPIKFSELKRRAGQEGALYGFSADKMLGFSKPILQELLIEAFPAGLRCPELSEEQRLFISSHLLRFYLKKEGVALNDLKGIFEDIEKRTGISIFDLVLFTKFQIGNALWETFFDKSTPERKPFDDKKMATISGYLLKSIFEKTGIKLISTNMWEQFEKLNKELDSDIHTNELGEVCFCLLQELFDETFKK